MARLPAPSNRSSKNVRNGPSPLQLRLTSLVREARWFVFAAVAAWLGLVLATWNSADPAWSQSVHAGVIRNRGGTFGANVSDFLLFLFGFSAWLWVVLLVQRVAVGFYRLTHLMLPKAKAEEPLPRVRWEIGIGFFLLLLGCMGFEALQFREWGQNLPAGAGGS
ncbi:DNA translocase FtsK 4TM domain-containing protein [Paenalcaligenes niemegkensis]|nr:DNA translocase FtsK 4TM domain-containing protein [Paenalcaligenes niemegkensis]